MLDLFSKHPGVQGDSAPMVGVVLTIMCPVVRAILLAGMDMLPVGSPTGLLDPVLDGTMSHSGARDAASHPVASSNALHWWSDILLPACSLLDTLWYVLPVPPSDFSGV